MIGTAVVMERAFIKLCNFREAQSEALQDPPVAHKLNGRWRGYDDPSEEACICCSNRIQNNWTMDDP